ncbi:hypothetical protein N7491_006978 [Penicillium cf. griseofulvum]|uniref:Uncharacterized protein n=1 Tax=Penicillium cf. griseofulvum TaxID=2972120 RepID=A0A9W9IX57_9EURO|nr:hypothetical protein N7472_009991 [Penicillium cf. griseofulvum]KAJ5429962.1 hypothetical protein N7491_006978 [Penicillium cf. griseofulvum]
MPPPTGNLIRDAESTWEQAYHDAWRHFQTCIMEVLGRLQWHNPSLEDHQTTIERLSRLPIEVDNIRSTGQAMFEHSPGCQTVRDAPITYFATDFIRDCLDLHFRLHMLAWRLMNCPMSDRTVYNRLLRLLDSIKDRVPD